VGERGHTTNGGAAARFTSQGVEIRPRETGLGESGVFYIVFPSSRPQGVYIHENCLLTVVERPGALNTKDGSTKVTLATRIVQG
jgi:hypothetical protein